MARFLKDELRSVYVNLMRLYRFEDYLESKSFKLFCVEGKLDAHWDYAKEREEVIASGGSVYRDTIPVRLEIFLNTIYEDSSNFPFHLSGLLLDYQRWQNISLDLTQIAQNLLKLGYTKKEVSVFVSKAVYSANTMRINESSPALASDKTVITPEKNDSNKIFIVHGHDEEMKEKVARLLSKLHLEPIILHEMPDNGKTIIEKIECYANEVNFAVILFTPDDEGQKRGTDQLKTRGRQNVVLEYGYFIGKYGRDRVVVLYKDVEELPSDIDGLLYTMVDKGESWKFALGRNLKAAGYDIDLNHLA